MPLNKQNQPADDSRRKLKRISGGIQGGGALRAALGYVPPAVTQPATSPFEEVISRLFGEEYTPDPSKKLQNRVDELEAEVKSLNSQVGEAYQAGIDDTLAELEIGDRARDYETLRREGS